MKKYFSKTKSRMSAFLMLMAVALTVVSLTSCEDFYVSSTLEGVWQGEVAQSVFNSRYGHSTEYTDVEIEFFNDPYRTTSGKGVEKDFISSRRYTTTFFYYTVKNGRIYLDYEDNTHLVIANYRLNSRQFSGTFCDYRTGRDIAQFYLYKVSGYDGYYNGYGNGYDNGYYY